MCMETEGDLTESVNFVIPIHKHRYVCTSRHSTVSQDPCDRLYTTWNCQLFFYLLDTLITFYNFARICDTHISSNILK